MSTANSDIKSAAKAAGIYLYNIADRLGVSENTLTRLLRRELPADKKAELMSLIAEIAAEQRTDTGEK